MFDLEYRIVQNEYDDFVGQHGFLKIKCNDYNYGEMYPKEIEKIVDKVSLYDWFERLAKVVKSLMTKDYVALSDVESFNTWIVFQKKNEKIVISIVEAKKEQGSHDIEFDLRNSQIGEWGNQVINFNQFKNKIIEKGKEYMQNIDEVNMNSVLINKLKQVFEEIV